MSNPFQTSVDEFYNPFVDDTWRDELPDSYNDPNINNTSSQTSNLDTNSNSNPNTSATNNNTDNYTFGSNAQSNYQMPTTSHSNLKDPTTGLVISEEALAAREAELARREARIANLEQQVTNGTYKPPENRKNFPPILKIWEYYPQEDLPAAAVPIFEKIKRIYIAAFGLFLINWFCCLCCFSKDCSKVVSPGTLIVLSTLYLFVFCPLSFECSFFVLYEGLKRGRAMRFFCGVVTYIIWFIFIAFNVIGIANSGSTGLITMIDLFSTSAKWVGFFALIFCLLGIALGTIMVLTFLQLIKFWKEEGLERKALGEASKMAADYARENPDVAKEAMTVALNPGNNI